MKVGVPTAFKVLGMGSVHRRRTADINGNLYFATLGAINPAEKDPYFIVDTKGYDFIISDGDMHFEALSMDDNTYSIYLNGEMFAEDEQALKIAIKEWVDEQGK